MVTRVVDLSRIGGGGGGGGRAKRRVKQNFKKTVWLYDFFKFYLLKVSIRLYSNYVKCKHIQTKIQSNQSRASGSKNIASFEEPTRAPVLTLNKGSKLKRNKVTGQAEDDKPQSVLSHLVRLFQIEKRACPHYSDTV